MRSCIGIQLRRFNRSSRSEVFLRKDVLNICSKFTGEHTCQSVISMKLLCNFIEITLQHGCSPVNLQHIFRTPFLKNTSGWLAELAKLRFLRQVNLVLTILFVLKLAFGRAALHGNDPFLILVLSTKKQYSSFFKKLFVFQKICFPIAALKTFKISRNCCIKTCRSLKRRAILKIPSTIL